MSLFCTKEFTNEPHEVGARFTSPIATIRYAPQADARVNVGRKRACEPRPYLIAIHNQRRKALLLKGIVAAVYHIQGYPARVIQLPALQRTYAYAEIE